MFPFVFVASDIPVINDPCVYSMCNPVYGNLVFTVCNPLYSVWNLVYGVCNHVYSVCVTVCDPVYICSVCNCVYM